MKKIIVEFEDHGQGFLQWTISAETGFILDCQPFEGDFYIGKKVLPLGNLHLEGILTIQDGERAMDINYPIKGVSVISEPDWYYLAMITQTYVLKNSLEKAFFEMLKSENRSLISSSDLKSFQGKIIQATDSLNQKFPRCKPLNVHWYSNVSYSVSEEQKHSDYFLSIGASICSFHLYAAKREEVIHAS